VHTIENSKWYSYDYIILVFKGSSNSMIYLLSMIQNEAFCLFVFPLDIEKTLVEASK
jgi:hypothetical protein